MGVLVLAFTYKRRILTDQNRSATRDGFGVAGRADQDASAATQCGSEVKLLLFDTTNLSEVNRQVAVAVDGEVLSVACVKCGALTVFAATTIRYEKQKPGKAYSADIIFYRYKHASVRDQAASAVEKHWHIEGLDLPSLSMTMRFSSPRPTALLLSVAGQECITIPLLFKRKPSLAPHVSMSDKLSELTLALTYCDRVQMKKPKPNTTILEAPNIIGKVSPIQPDPSQLGGQNYISLWTETEDNLKISNFANEMTMGGQVPTRATVKPAELKEYFGHHALKPESRPENEDINYFLVMTLGNDIVIRREMIFMTNDFETNADDASTESSDGFLGSREWLKTSGLKRMVQSFGKEKRSGQEAVEEWVLSDTLLSYN
eukprot:Selendium_serpulae@DN6048_c0_g3_i1.p1